MLSAPESPILLSVVCERCLNKNNTQEISRDVSEVFDWSAFEMVTAPYSPILASVVCENNEFVFLHPDVESNSSWLPMSEEYVGICFLVVQTVCEQPETTSYKQA